jgi:hypothetical protein
MYYTHSIAFYPLLEAQKVDAARIGRFDISRPVGSPYPWFE